MTAPVTDYPVGAFALTKIGGPTGFWVGVMQALAGIPSRWTHALIIGSEGRIYEAGPGGVYIGRTADLKGKPHLVSDVVIRTLVKRADILDPEYAADYERQVRCLAGDVAHTYLGTPYSFLDYLALALLHLEAMLTGKPTGRTSWWITRRVRRRVQDSGHLICSAFVDRWAADLGFQFFNDDRLPGDVSPSDLDAWLDDNGSAAA